MRWMVPLVWLGCSGKTEDSSAGSEFSESADPYMNILSPTNGEFIDEGQEVLLEAEGRLGTGELGDLTDVVWASDDGVYTVEGNALVVTDLHAGLYTLNASGVVDGQAVSAAVEVAVYAQ